MKSSLIEALEPRRLLSTYYVSASGNDGKSGLSPAAAWRSIDRVNTQTLKPGDTILFQGGKTFSGSIYVPSTEGGTAKKPVVFVGGDDNWYVIGRVRRSIYDFA